MPYQSSNNAILIDNCDPLQNLTVLLKVVEDLATVDGGGFSLQLNAYPPPGMQSQGQSLTQQQVGDLALTWFQYVIVVQNGNLYYQIQYWANGARGYGPGQAWPPGYTPNPPNTTPWLPVLPGDPIFGQFGSAPGNTIPRDSEMQIKLTTGEGGVTSAYFSVTDPNGNVSDYTFDFTRQVNAEWPISAFEVNLVGPPGGAATFTTGLTASRGIFYYSVSGTLSVQSGGPGAACGEYGAITNESSNAVYSDVVGAPGPTVTQSLGQPVDCALNSMLRKEAGSGAQRMAERLRHIRDTKVKGTPAGLWLIEALESRPAELAGLLDQDPELRHKSFDLLRRAERIVTADQTFDDETIELTKDALRRAACLMPPSLSEAALQTIVEALRGSTLEEGLEAASQTIRPRSRPTPSQHRD